MKKIEKIILKSVLDDSELKELKGGNDNSNIDRNCSCTYYNGGRTYNGNHVVGCKCTCVS